MGVLNMRLLAIILTLIIFATNLNAQSLKDLQSKLNAIGFWSGNPDGVMGKKTKHGIESFLRYTAADRSINYSIPQLVKLANEFRTDFQDIKSGEFFNGQNSWEILPPSAPNSITVTDDPLGTFNDKIYKFTLPSGYCDDRKYQGYETSDCYYNSTRTLLGDTYGVQPKEAWYQWHIFLPKNYPIGGVQANGGMSLVYFKGNCPTGEGGEHLSFGIPFKDLQFQKYLNLVFDYECGTNFRASQKLIEVEKLLGRWTKFELFVKWSNKKDGQIKVFINEEEVFTHKGTTIQRGNPSFNQFRFGQYLCCTISVDRIKKAEIYYADVVRANSREGLKKK